MPYRNVSLNINGFQSGVCSNATSINYTAVSSSPVYTLGTNLLDIPMTQNSWTTIFDNGIFKCEGQYASDPANHEFYLRFYYYDTLFLPTGTWGYWTYTFFGIAFGVNDDTEEGAVFLCCNNNNEYTVTQYNYGSTGRHNAFLAITESEIPPYTWTSVPAISGKNGILLPMTTLNDINDGNEVTTSDTSKFNLNDRSNIKNLVDAVVNDF